MISAAHAQESAECVSPYVDQSALNDVLSSALVLIAVAFVLRKLIRAIPVRW